MAKLYEIANDLMSLDEMLSTLQENEISESAPYERVIQDTIESMEGEFEDKVENCIKYMRNLEAEANMYKEEKDRLAKLEKTARNKAERMKDYIEQSMIAAGYNHKNKKKIESSVGKIGLQKNPATVEIIDENRIPLAFLRRVEKHWDKRELIKWAKDAIEEKDIEEQEFDDMGIKYVNNKYHLRVR